MRTHRSSPARGLFAGLLALIVFGSAAVAMTAHGSSTPAGATPAQQLSAQPVAATTDRDADGGRFRGHDRDR
jgi:hypothetical protein